MTTDDTRAGQVLTNVWRLVLLRAVLLLVVGLAFLLRPDLPITAAIVVMGAYWFVDGILTVVRSLEARRSVGYWGLGVAVGAISMLAGLVVFSHPFASARLTATFLMTFLGIAAVVSGVASIVTGVRLRKASGGETYLLVGGGVSVVFGILLLTSPMYSILMLVKILGAIAVIVGIALLIEALRIRRAARTT